MKWFKKKERPLKDLVVKSPLRDFLLDSQVEPVGQYMTLLGLPPMSEEVIEMERRNSDVRVSRIAALLPLIHDYAHAISAASIALRKDQVDGEMDVPEEAWNAGHAVLETAAMTTLIGVLSQFVEMGVIEINVED